MPLFSAIGGALLGGAAASAAAGTAFTVGVGATALAVGAGVGAYALGAGFKSGDTVDSRIEAATGTGILTAEEARSAATKKAYRSGVLHTSPTGLYKETPASSVKLK